MARSVGADVVLAGAIAAAGALFVAVAAPLLSAAAGGTVDPIGVVVLVAAAIGVAVAAGLWRADRRTDASRGSAWDAVPRWQYDGLQVVSGGLAQGEQERAIQELKEEAAATERATGGDGGGGGGGGVGGGRHGS